jgi:hypothetical protein
MSWLNKPNKSESSNPNEITRWHGVKDSPLASPQLSVLRSSMNRSKRRKSFLWMLPRFHGNSCVTAAWWRWRRGIKKDKKLVAVKRWNVAGRFHPSGRLWAESDAFWAMR